MKAKTKCDESEIETTYNVTYEMDRKVWRTLIVNQQ